MNKFLSGIVIAVIAGLIVNYLSSSNSVNSTKHVQIINNQQSVSQTTNGGSSSVNQVNNQSININYSSANK